MSYFEYLPVNFVFSMDRRRFISLSYLTGIAFISPFNSFIAGAGQPEKAVYMMTVTGKISAAEMGVTLCHEHIVTDFTGAEKIKQPQYSGTSVFEAMLPHLRALKQIGVNTMIECTPAYIGRDVKLLKQLSVATGLNIITNTGYYAAAGQKYLPAHAYIETSFQLAARWLKEWRQGIDGTGIRPGFIKLGVDEGVLNPVQIKLFKAAAQTHLKSGLKIAVHTGNAVAAIAYTNLMIMEGVDARALIWVHAQNDDTREHHIALAKKGCWISLDGVSQTAEVIVKYCGFVKALKQEGLLNKLLLSHDDGFAVNAKGRELQFDAYDNGNTAPYQSLFTVLKPALLRQGITEEEFHTIVVNNPREAFKIEVLAMRGGSDQYNNHE